MCGDKMSEERIKRKIKLKINIKKILNLILTLVCIVGIIYSGFHIIEWYRNTQANKKIKNKMEEHIIYSMDDDGNEKINIDFKKLKEQNPDTVGYIKINNTNIDYVVVKGNDNSYYLKHNFNKEWNIAGWIFADYHNKLDETDKNLVIYGHDTKDGSMFGTLKNTHSKEWQENKDNLKITFITEMHRYTYEIFSTYVSEPEEYYINTEFSTIESFNEFVKTIKERSESKYDVEVTKDDKILTLSSCTPSGKKRVVVHAKLTETK